MKNMITLIFMNYIFGLTGLELIDKIDNINKPTDTKVDIVMTLTNKNGKSRESVLRSFSKDDGSRQIMWFLKPASDKGVSFLKIEHENKPDQMKLWLPAFKKIKRISTGKRSDSFMGSDMSYEDMSTRQVNEFNFKIIRTELYENTGCYVLESIPKDYIETEYSKHISWIDSSLFLPLKEESYSKSGLLLKEKYFSYSTIDGYKILTNVKVTNMPKKHSTQIKFENIKLNNNLKDNLFHERSLKRLPSFNNK